MHDGQIHSWLHYTDDMPFCPPQWCVTVGKASVLAVLHPVLSVISLFSLLYCMFSWNQWSHKWYRAQPLRTIFFISFHSIHTCNSISPFYKRNYVYKWPVVKSKRHNSVRLQNGSFKGTLTPPKETNLTLLVCNETLDKIVVVYTNPPITSAGFLLVRFTNCPICHRRQHHEAATIYHIAIVIILTFLHMSHSRESVILMWHRLSLLGPFIFQQH